MITSSRFFKVSPAVLFAATLLVSNSAWSQSAKPAPAVVIEADGVSITTLDLEAELAKAPPEVRVGFMQQPERLAQLASNLVMRRALAKQAQAAGLAKTPFNQAALQLGADRVLSDIQLAELDKINRPSDMVLEQRARDVYRAETKRFEIPEEVKASHILILATEENAEAKASELLAELKAVKILLSWPRPGRKTLVVVQRGEIWASLAVVVWPRSLKRRPSNSRWASSVGWLKPSLVITSSR